METLLVKIFATALALSQVMTTPNNVKTEFNRQSDQQQVAQILQAGCTHMIKAFAIEDINIDDLIATAMDDPQAIGSAKVLRGINLDDLLTAYKQFCKGEKVAHSAVDLGQVIDFYNEAAADLPDHTKLKNHQLPGSSVVLDRKNKPFAEVFEENQRRVWVPLAQIPQHVRNAFIAAEDKRFYQHKGIDEHGLIRAFVSNLAQSHRPAGGSTITQQVVKNLLVGEAVTYDRKIREMIVAARLESTLTKDEILELYLNCVFLGRGAWGVEVAAHSYFGKPAKALTVTEGALLAAVTKGPTYFSPDRAPARARERLAYVLTRMKEDGMLPADFKIEDPGHLPELPIMVASARPRRDIGFHFVDQVVREAKSAAGLERVTDTSYSIHSTVDPALQRAAEQSLQEGLSRYERSSGRVVFNRPEANLTAAIQKLQTDATRTDKRPYWQQALANARLPLYDVHWTPAVVIGKPGGGRVDSWRVGLSDGRTVPLSLDGASAQNKIGLDDVVLVHLIEGRGKSAVRAELRVRPQVQGMVVALENKTGRVLAMTGGFSYPLSQLNRATQAVRQPGSTIKPLSYLAALGTGLQPNTLVNDASITLPPINGGHSQNDYWTPKNYDGGGGGVMTMRSALENSRNLATVHLLEGGIEAKPEQSLERLCELALEAQIYKDCIHFYPFVLGAEPVRPIDLAAFYAAIANEGVRPTPHVIDFDRARRAHHLSLRYERGIEPDQVGRPGRLLPAQNHDAGRAGARNRACDRRLLFLRRREDRHVGRRERRLVRRLFQRRDRRGVDRLRQCRQQASHARRRRDRRRRRGADLRAGDARSVERRHPADRARPAFTRGQAAPQLLIDRVEVDPGMPAHRQQGQGHRHDGCAGDGGSDGRGRYAKRGDEKGRRDEDASKHKVAHEHSRRERTVARQTAPQSTGWGGGGWFGAATQPTTTGWNYRW